MLPRSNAHGNERSTWSDCSRNNAEGMRELARSVERPSEPQANELTYLLALIAQKGLLDKWPFFLSVSFSIFSVRSS